MHLAVLADVALLAVDDCQGVVVQARRPSLEETHENRGAALRRDLLERCGARAGNRFGEREEVRVLGLAEITRPEEFRQADDVGALADSLARQRQRFLHVLVDVFGHPHLHDADVHRWFRFAFAHGNNYLTVRRWCRSRSVL